MIRINDVQISYKDKNDIVNAVKGVSFDINEGEYLALFGPAGSGKSTLLAAIAGMLIPDKGDIVINKYKLKKISRTKRALVRARQYGIILQFSEMVNRFTVAENLYFSWYAANRGVSETDFHDRLNRLTDRLDMKNLLDSFPAKLSGGQMQKAAIARAFIKNSPIILADEPSGDLDPANIEKVKELFLEENAEGKTIFLVTHDMKLAFDAKTIYEMKDGRLCDLIKHD